MAMPRCNGLPRVLLPPAREFTAQLSLHSKELRIIELADPLLRVGPQIEQFIRTLAVVAQNQLVAIVARDSGIAGR